MTLLARWQQLLGIRSEEGRTVGLFFLHNFLLGVGTILVYVAANVILLEYHPERNLPLAYVVGAGAMIAVSRVYAHYEHHTALQTLAGRVLVAVVVLTGVLAVLVWAGHSVATAVAIMAGYRVIYLLTNLEFWGVSAVVFDVRQSRRLFSVISSGDLPAKAAGAVLAILIHHHTALLWLLLLGFGAYLAALLTVRATGRTHAVEVQAARRAARQQAVTPGLRGWLGHSHLVLYMCLSMLTIAAVTTGIEYSFFINVKQRFHGQAEVMRYVGGVLVLTYLAAMLFKLLLTGQVLNRVGYRVMLLALPAALLLGLGAYLALPAAGTAGELLLYFCGLFVVLEVLRRAVFDPVFLVLFQPLPPAERLQAHTLVKGLYEPIGMGLTGALLLALPERSALQGAGFGWLALCTAAALLLLHRAYGAYLAELQHAVGRRFAAPAAPAPAISAPADAPPTSTPPDTAVLIARLLDNRQRATAADQLVRLGEAALPALAAVPRTSPDEVLIRRVAQVLSHLPLPASRQTLVALAQQPHLFRREAALRALRGLPQDAADAPVFQALVQEEMRLAQRLLHGQATAPDAALARALDYELHRVEQRLFGLLRQLYPPQVMADAQRGVAHAARERQANALEILDNLIPRPLYQGLQTLLDSAPPATKARAFDRLLGTTAPAAPVAAYLVASGETLFTDWTISVALRHWQPAPATAAALLPYLRSTSALVRESAATALARLTESHPAVYQHLQTLHPGFPALLAMSHDAPTSPILAAARVALLRRTSLFAETPENVLSSIVPIMHEVPFADGQQIFAQGDLGSSLFVVQAGQVGIFAGSQQLATFGPGDFFGELALLDAEPRSAAAVAQGAVTAFRLDQEDFYDVMEERPEVLRNILRVLCQRLRRQNEKSAA